jgi:hypothetical protein
VSDSLWRADVPPFRLLDPALRRAEALLLADVATVLPDERGAAGCLNARLEAAVLRLECRGGRWCLAVADPVAEAACAMGVVIAAGNGWRRVKYCVHCGRPFLDRTNGVTRRGCTIHPARSTRR